jgi:carbamoyltransferase
MVTAEQFDRFFLGPRGKYMQYRVDCTEEAQELLPAICHRDNSARPQVVYQEDDPWLHELLVEYGRRSGVECLINTSLNKRKKPICNTYEDVRREMRGKELDVVCLPHEAWSPPTKESVEQVAQSNLNLMV